MRLTTTILLFTACCAIAAAQDDKARLAQAREQLKALGERVEALPAPSEPDFRFVPTPTLRALDLARELRDFARLNDDLSLAADAWRLVATTRRSDGDVVRAVAASRQAAGRDDDPARAAGDRGAAAELSAQFGALEEAQTILAELAESLPGHDRAPAWKQLAARLQSAAAAQQRDVEAVLNGFTAGSQRSRALHRAQVFAYKNPLHPETGGLLTRLLGQIKDAPARDKLGYFERIAFYLPGHPDWTSSTRAAVQELAREGHYEKAYLYLTLLLERSELLAPGETGKLAALGQLLRARLDRIASRRLEVKPPTKDARYRDLYRRARGGEDAATLQEMARGFVEDYPECSEIPELRVLCARGMAADLPEEALAHYKAVAEEYPASDQARDAFTGAADLIEKSSGPEEAESWLKSLGERYESPDERARIALLRARILDAGEQWEEARTALRAVAPVDPFVKREVEQRIRALDAKIGE